MLGERTSAVRKPKTLELQCVPVYICTCTCTQYGSCVGLAGEVRVLEILYICNWGYKYTVTKCCAPAIVMHWQQSYTCQSSAVVVYTQYASPTQSHGISSYHTKPFVAALSLFLSLTTYSGTYTCTHVLQHAILHTATYYIVYIISSLATQRDYLHY